MTAPVRSLISPDAPVELCGSEPTIISEQAWQAGGAADGATKKKRESEKKKLSAGARRGLVRGKRDGEEGGRVLTYGAVVVGRVTRGTNVVRRGAVPTVHLP